jgi:hypothetical protein
MGQHARQPLGILHERHGDAFSRAPANARQAAQRRNKVIEGNEVVHWNTGLLDWWIDGFFNSRHSTHPIIH